MGSASSRALRKFKGEEDGRPVAEWLNRYRKTGEGSSVVELLRRLKRLAPRMSLREWIEQEQHGPSKRHYVNELNEVNRILRKYSMWPMVLRRSATVSKFRKGITEARGKFYCKWSSGGNPATPIVHGIVKLGERGLLSRLSECIQCKLWFYARFAHQTFCSTRCREKHFRASPSWKASRREYMRAYRQREREGIAQSIVQAKKVKKEDVK